jgi:hypothetical protein
MDAPMAWARRFYAVIDARNAPDGQSAPRTQYDGLWPTNYRLSPAITGPALQPFKSFNMLVETKARAKAHFGKKKLSIGIVQARY